MQLTIKDQTFSEVIELIRSLLEVILQRSKWVTIWISSQIYTKHEATGILQPSPFLESNEYLLFCPSYGQLQTNNFPDYPHTPYTLKEGTHIAIFWFWLTNKWSTMDLSTLLRYNIFWMSTLLLPSTITKPFLKQTSPTKSGRPIASQHHKIEAMNGNTHPYRHAAWVNYAKYIVYKNWNRRTAQSLEHNSKNMFGWTDSTLHLDAKKAVETLFVDFHDIFAWNRFLSGITVKLKVQLSKLSLFVRTVLAELSLLHKWGILKTLHFIYHASRIFSPRKPKRKLRLLVDLRELYTLIADTYFNIIFHPIGSTITEAAQNVADTNLFWKVYYFHAYHCLQVADRQSNKLLAFNLVSRVTAYRWLEQGLSRSLSTFSSVIR